MDYSYGTNDCSKSTSMTECKSMQLQVGLIILGLESLLQVYTSRSGIGCDNDRSIMSGIDCGQLRTIGRAFCVNNPRRWQSEGRLGRIGSIAKCDNFAVDSNLQNC
jgi:hypothetical protein